MMRTTCATSLALMLALGGCGGDDITEEKTTTNGETATTATTTSTVTDADETGPPVNITLTEIDNSGLRGTATLTAVGDRTRVEMQLVGTPPNPLPAHIHEGTCDELDPDPKYPLPDIRGSSVSTTLDVSMEELRESEPLALNVHKSADDLDTYVACGTFDFDTPITDE